MKNIEKYYKEILKNKDSFAVNEQTGKVSSCSKTICENCKFYYANSCYEYDNCEEAKLSWLFEENEESNSILTEEDKKILKDVINVFNSFKKEIADIRKRHICRGCYLYINYIDGGEDVSSIETHTTLPFNGDKLFKGMELNKRYTLEELEL